MRRHAFAACAVLALGAVALATGVAAQGNVLQQRQALMKEMGDQVKAGSAVLKGQAKYDAEKAAAIFKSLGASMQDFGKLFPPGSNTGDTKAAPAVWSDRAGFDAAIASFNKVVAANAGAAGTEAGFKTAFTAVANECRTCHETYKLR